MSESACFALEKHRECKRIPNSIQESGEFGKQVIQDEDINPRCFTLTLTDTKLLMG